MNKTTAIDYTEFFLRKNNITENSKAYDYVFHEVMLAYDILNNDTLKLLLKNLVKFFKKLEGK